MVHIPFLIVIYCHLFYINYVLLLLENNIYERYLYGNI